MKDGAKYLLGTPSEIFEDEKAIVNAGLAMPRTKIFPEQLSKILIPSIRTDIFTRKRLHGNYTVTIRREERLQWRSKSYRTICARVFISPRIGSSNQADIRYFVNDPDLVQHVGCFIVGPCLGSLEFDDLIRLKIGLILRTIRPIILLLVFAFSVQSFYRQRRDHFFLTVLL